jgi:long-chain fatty acid transport protein
MKTRGISTAALLFCSTAACAGGLDRSGQGIGALFEDGNIVELSFGSVSPSVEGTFLGAVSSGNVGADYTQSSLSLKMDLNANVSFAFIIDQPFGASVDYGNADAGYPIGGSSAEFRSTGLTLAGRYKFNDNFSVHAGLRQIGIDADVAVISPGPDYVATYATDTSTGYLIGAAYERPDIALRVALTYNSEMDFSHATQLQVAPGVFAPVPNTEYTLPQSVNLDFQTGVAANTLVFGSIRWAEWSTTQINSFLYPGNPIVGYKEDTISYSIGIGRKFSDTFSGAISVGYEAANNNLADNLAPTDGYTSIQVGGTYKITDALELTGGVRYIMLGDAVTEGFGAEFADNTALALGVSIGYRF